MKQITIILFLIAVFSLMCCFEIKEVNATVYLRADGSTNSPLIQTDNNYYSLVDYINDEIFVHRNNIILDGNGYAVDRIRLSDVQNVTIKNFSISGDSHGILFHRNCEKITIINNTIVGTGGSGITTNYEVTNCLVQNNNISKNGINGITLSGNNIEIVANYISGNGEDGILVSGSSNIVSENQIINSMDDGIVVYGTRNRITNNNINGCGDKGIFVDDLDYSTDNDLVNNVVLNNQISNCKELIVPEFHSILPLGLLTTFLLVLIFLRDKQKKKNMQ